MEVGFLRKEDRKTHIWLEKKMGGGEGGVGEEMWNKADGEETPLLKSPRDSEQEVLLLPTRFISWLCTLPQESVYTFPQNTPSTHLSAKE